MARSRCFQNHGGGGESGPSGQYVVDQQNPLAVDFARPLHLKGVPQVLSSSCRSQSGLRPSKANAAKIMRDGQPMLVGNGLT